MYARQSLYQGAILAALGLWDRDSYILLQPEGWPQTCEPPLPRNAEISGMHHHVQLAVEVLGFGGLTMLP